MGGLQVGAELLGPLCQSESVPGGQGPEMTSVGATLPQPRVLPRVLQDAGSGDSVLTPPPPHPGEEAQRSQAEGWGQEASESRWARF